MSRYQPIGMGIIVCFKFGYHVQLIEYLLQLFDVEEGYESIEACRERAKIWWNGLSVGVNPKMLDFMDLSLGIWNGNAEYVYKNTMQNCWLKAYILSPEIMADLWNPIKNNESVNSNAGTHDNIPQDIDDTYNMDFSGDKEATIAYRDISIS